MTRLNTSKLRFLRAFYFLLLCVFMGSCATNPVTGKKELMLMSTNQEIQMGQNSDPQIVAAYGLYDDKALNDFITQKGMEMAKISHRPDLPYEFKVMDTPVVNAFAVPGGYVYFTRGILAHFNNEAEFAGVLGHEIGHITARHSAKQYTRSMAAQVGLIAGMVVSEQFRQFGEQLSQGVQLLFLKFGRDAESQSDRLGVEYSTKIGYDAHKMAGFFRTIGRLQEQAGGSVPTFLSTHPDPANRYETVNKLADQWQKKMPNKQFIIDRNDYLKRIDGIVYGEDPKQGYVQNNVFYHPELKFQFDKPNGWQLVNSPAQVQMAPQDGKAMMTFTIVPEKSLQEAARNFAEQAQLQVKQTDYPRVNGLPAIAMISEQYNQQNQQTITVLSYFIQYNDMIYLFYGVSLKQDYNRYRTSFLQAMQSFAQLTDPSKINVYPERLKVVPVKQTGTLSNALKSYNQANDRMNELAILNGMELNDQVQSGMLIKTIAKGTAN